MTAITDLLIPGSGLNFTAPDTAHFAADLTDHTVAGALLQQVVRAYAMSEIEGSVLSPVSVSFDITGDVQPAVATTFKAQIDRKTRTLIFASGIAAQGASPIAKATLVYRIG